MVLVAGTPPLDIPHPPLPTPNTMALQGKNAKGIADVVFVIDRSPSMNPVIHAVKSHVQGFVDSIHHHSPVPIQLRLGLVSHFSDGGDRKGVHHWDFTEDIACFKKQLESCDSMSASGDEFGLPALDRALDFPWRPQCRRFVVSFTDEPVSGGHDPDFQRSQLQNLLGKFHQLGVAGYLIGPACPDYDQLGRGARMVRVLADHSELARYDFARFLAELGRTVSQATESPILAPVNANLYRI
jgi:hypothetical protein